MTEIVFASNNKSHWPFSVTSTTGGTFDSARVPYGLALQYKEYMTSPTWVPLSTDTTWIHFRMHVSSLEFTDATLPVLITVHDVNGSVIFRASKKASTNDYILDFTLYDGTTTDAVTQSSQFTVDTVNGVDFKYTDDGVSTELLVYANAGLVASMSLPNATTRGKPAYMIIGGALVNDSGSLVQIMSEFIVADSDTRNGRLDLLRPTTEGGETDWAGLVTALSDDDPTTGMTTMLADQRETVALSAYTGATNISAIVVTTQSFAGANGPQNMRHTVRMSAVNYDSPDDLPLDDVLHYGLTDFEINPATSAPWVSGDLSSLEIGFVSKT